MNKIITGNILDIQEGIICHQVNCQRVAGAGLALQIRQKWPDWYVQFKISIPMLGRCNFWSAENNLSIASLYAQDGYDRTGNNTDYVALRRCMDIVSMTSRFGKEDRIYIPYGIGCGLAGGDWNIVSQIIAEELPNAVIVKLP